ncbi:hypothetical protein ACXEGK_004008 [Klebsiella quasipneumoniae]
MNTLLSDLKNAVETMSTSAFENFLIEMIKNFEIELLDSSNHQDMEKKIFFDNLYLFSLHTKNLDFSFNECRQKKIEIKTQIEQLKNELQCNPHIGKDTLYNHISEIKKTLTDGSLLPHLNNDEISKILEKIKNDDIDITYIEYIKRVISTLKYKATSKLDLISLDRTVRIEAGQVKNYIESKQKTILYIDTTLTHLLSKNKVIEKKIEEKRLENDKFIELENIWKEHLNHFFNFGYKLDTTLTNVLSRRYKGPQQYFDYDSDF